MPPPVDLYLRFVTEGEEVLNKINKDLAVFGHVSQTTRAELRDFRADSLAQVRAISALGAAWRNEHQSLVLIGQAFQQVSSMASMGVRMIEQYNIAMIRVQQLNQAVTQSQNTYNEAVARYGAASPQAIKAAENLREAQTKLANAQRQTNLMFALQATQIVGMLPHIISLGRSLSLLTTYLRTTAGAVTVLRTAIYGLEGAVSLLSGVAMVKLLDAFGGPLAQKALKSWSQILNDVYKWMTTLGQEETKTVQATALVTDEVYAAVVAAKANKEAIDLWTEAYKNGKVMLWSFVDGLIKLGLTQDEIKRIVLDTAVKVPKTYDELVKGALSAYSAEVKLEAELERLSKLWVEGGISVEFLAGELVKLGLTEEEVVKKLVSITSQVPKTFKEQFIDKAQKIFENFKECVTGKSAELGPAMKSSMDDVVSVTNRAIQQGLIGTAQAGMEAFRDCVTGKMWDMKDNAQSAIDDLVNLTNMAINSGLKGEAQKNIDAFVKCAVNKDAQMVSQIDTHLKSLTDTYKSNLKQIAVFTRRGQLDRAEAYRLENESIKKIIDQLNLWRNAILTKTTLPVTRTATIAPPAQPPTLVTPPVVPPQPPPTPGGCPLCGAPAGSEHNSWCPILTNEWYGFQRGGVVSKPTLALLGEGYKKEAVIPLQRGTGLPANTTVLVDITISSLHTGDINEAQKFFRQLERKVVEAVRQGT